MPATGGVNSRTHCPVTEFRCSRRRLKLSGHAQGAESNLSQTHVRLQ